MIRRTRWLKRIKTALSRNKVVTLIGPRQCGKTTLARELVAEDSPNYFDLEDPVSWLRLKEPMMALESLQGLVVIDEIQRYPDLFPILRVLVDRRTFAGKFLILGSASGDLLRQSSESLAGRMETLNLHGFSLQELGKNVQQHWLRGGFPRSYEAANGADSMAWRKEFMRALLERDFPQWGVRISATALWRFWMMLANSHSQIWNAAQFARAMDVSMPTVKRYLDLLSDAFMVRQLQPWAANTKKRQVKSPKIYLRDSGLLHQLLAIATQHQLLTHPQVGASWEGYVIEEILAATQPGQAHFWATHQGAEIDLLLSKDGRRIGIECKRADAPRMTRSVHTAIRELGLDKVLVVYPGKKRYPLADGVEAVPFGDVVKDGVW